MVLRQFLEGEDTHHQRPHRVDAETALVRVGVPARGPGALAACMIAELVTVETPVAHPTRQVVAHVVVRAAAATHRRPAVLLLELRAVRCVVAGAVLRGHHRAPATLRLVVGVVRRKEVGEHPPRVRVRIHTILALAELFPVPVVVIREAVALCDPGEEEDHHACVENENRDRSRRRPREEGAHSEHHRRDGHQEPPHEHEDVDEVGAVQHRHDVG
mmetsp:Transcript_17401/g.36393  ORF Transcript_17401/g.36393 Transcript_17401/m.36393 type:complete len:216 (-) Transcript_17401:691-1338(-)